MPTTTSAPAVRRRRTAAERWRTERVGGIRWVTSFAPIMITQTSGTWAGSSRTSTTCRSRSSDWAPGSATFRSRTGRSATAASPEAMRAPGVCRARWTPWPHGRGVAEHDEPERGIVVGVVRIAVRAVRTAVPTAVPAAVEALRARRMRAVSVAHHPLGHPHLGQQHTHGGRTHQSDATTAVSRARRDAPGHPRPRHARHTSPPPPSSRTPTHCPVPALGQSRREVNREEKSESGA